MNEYKLLNQSGIKLITSWKTGQACVRAEDVEMLLKKKQAEIDAVAQIAAQLQSLLKKISNLPEGFE